VPAAILLDANAVAAEVRRLAGEIERDHPDGVVLIGVLKGALLFVADLARAITGVPVVLDFIAISRFAPDSGRVKILHDLDTDISGRDVVVVEDLVDTGLTLAYLIGQLRERSPRTLSACALLDRSARRIVPTELRYRGVELCDEFVLGYGLHTRDLYRNLPFVAVGDRGVVAAEPGAYVNQLYASDGRETGPGPVVA
jgi:hypoxanthine phosphoribosyltransferase